MPPRETRPSPLSDGQASSRDAVANMAGLGALLRNRREESGLSVRQAAEAAGVSFSTITRVESGAQPDLATFLKLCSWLRVRPEQFFVTGGRREGSTVETVVHHLFADPALGPEAAGKIATVVKDLYAALAEPPSPTPSLACHLRAAPTLRAGVPDALNGVLTDLHAAVQRKVRDGQL